MTGTLEALTSGRADLAIGVSVGASNVGGLQQAPLGDLLFIYVVAPHHPLANAPEPITDATLREHRAVAVADSAARRHDQGPARRAGCADRGQHAGQDTGATARPGWRLSPEPMVRPYVEAGPTGGAQGRTARTQRAHALCLGRPGLRCARPGAAVVAKPVAKPSDTACAAGKPPPFLMRKPARGV